MNPKSLILLEYHKVLARLKAYASFSASAELAENLRPSGQLNKVLEGQKVTREARYLLSVNNGISFQGAADLRPLLRDSEHGIVLDCTQLLNLRSTLLIARSATRILRDLAEEVPTLASMGEQLSDGRDLIDLITRSISEGGEVLDTASEDLGRIRSEMKIAYARLMDRLNQYLNDANTARLLQDNLITQRNGRFVLPLRSENKGRIKALVHDQSASGATLFVEPLVVVELNNKFRELELAERDEILRILQALSRKVATYAPELSLSANSMAQIDLALMKASYAEDLQAVEPVFHSFEGLDDATHPGSVLRLRRARHPLLDPAKVVPLDIEMDSKTYTIILTGPNTGGKTITLKTAGLLTLMAQSGLQIPAQSGSALSVFREIYADIGDEQSIEQSLSTFSGHISQLVKILAKADYRCLVLLDELGAGTDPQEGAALARAVMDELLERKITSIVATHYPELKVYAHVTPGVVNASLEFDLETLRPTYRLMIGLPGHSNALAIAQRLGLNQKIIDSAREELNPLNLQTEDLLQEAHRQRQLSLEALAEAERSRQQAEALRIELNARLAQIEEERQEVLAESRKKAEEELTSLQDELTDLRREMNKLHRQPGKQEALREMQQKTELLLKKQTHAHADTSKPAPVAEPFRVGEKLRVRRLQAEGQIVSFNGDDLEVLVGNLRLRVKAEDVERRGAEVQEAVTLPAGIRYNGRNILPEVASPGLELDLRGKRVEDALEMLTRYLENSYSSGLIFGRVIHGYGTGAVRQAVREELRHSPYVKRWERGDDKEGGDGVSVIFFKQQ